MPSGRSSNLRRLEKKDGADTDFIGLAEAYFVVSVHLSTVSFFGF